MCGMSLRVLFFWVHLPVAPLHPPLLYSSFSLHQQRTCRRPLPYTTFQQQISMATRFPWRNIGSSLSLCKRFHCPCAAASLFQTHRRICLVHAGATLSSSPMSPPNEAKPQWTTLSLPPCTPGMLREVYASSPSLPTSLETRWATTEIRIVWSP